MCFRSLWEREQHHGIFRIYSGKTSSASSDENSIQAHELIARRDLSQQEDQTIDHVPYPYYEFKIISVICLSSSHQEMH